MESAARMEEEGKEAKHKLYIVGVGPGTPEFLTGEARRAISRCRRFAGGWRQLKLAPVGAETCVIGSDLNKVRQFVEGGLDNGDVCVLASGDPGCYSILPFLRKHFNDTIRVVPGLSSVQLLSARLGEPWQGWRLESLHGRSSNKLTPPEADTVYLCDDKNTPQALARLLLKEMKNCQAIVGSNLGTPEEEVFLGGMFDVAGRKFPGNSLLLVSPDKEPHSFASWLETDDQEAETATEAGKATGAAPGIPDNYWLRIEDVPLSKREVRSVLMAYASPRGCNVVWDIGAGTGSYGIECSLLEPRARVISIDKSTDAIALTEENAERFGANVETVCAEAPECLAGLPRPDLVIVGGSEGRLEEIFRAVVDMLAPGGRIVVTAVKEETSELARNLFEASGLQNVGAVRVSISRGDGKEWTDNNPVVIYSGDMGE